MGYRLKKREVPLEKKEKAQKRLMEIAKAAITAMDIKPPEDGYTRHHLLTYHDKIKDFIETLSDEDRLLLSYLYDSNPESINNQDGYEINISLCFRPLAKEIESQLAEKVEEARRESTREMVEK